MARRRDSFALRQPLPRTLSFALGFVAPCLVALVWCALTYGHFAPPDFLPSPSEVVRGTIQLFVQQDLGTAILVSSRRIALAWQVCPVCRCAAGGLCVRRGSVWPFPGAAGA